MNTLPFTSADKRGVFRRGCYVPRVINHQQRIVFAHRIADFYLDLGDNPAFEILHYLNLPGGNHLALAHRGFADVGKSSPHEKRNDEQHRAP